jgi:hypothetical protein
MTRQQLLEALITCAEELGQTSITGAELLTEALESGWLELTWEGEGRSALAVAEQVAEQNR